MPARSSRPWGSGRSLGSPPRGEEPTHRHLVSVGADQGFAAERVWEDAAERGIVAYIPPQKTMLPREGRAPRTKAQQLALAARTRAKNEHGLWAYRRRMVDAEGVIAELKNHHALDRVRCRGTPTFHVQLLLGCAAINPKRLAAHAPTAQQGVAAAPRAATAAPAPETTTWLVGISAAVVGVLSAWRRTWAARNENSDG